VKLRTAISCAEIC